MFNQPFSSENASINSENDSCFSLGKLSHFLWTTIFLIYLRFRYFCQLTLVSWKFYSYHFTWKCRKKSFDVFQMLGRLIVVSMIIIFFAIKYFVILSVSCALKSSNRYNIRVLFSYNSNIIFYTSNIICTVMCYCHTFVTGKMMFLILTLNRDVMSLYSLNTYHKSF